VARGHLLHTVMPTIIVPLFIFFLWGLWGVKKEGPLLLTTDQGTAQAAVRSRQEAACPPPQAQ